MPLPPTHQPAPEEHHGKHKKKTEQGDAFLIDPIFDPMLERLSAPPPSSRGTSSRSSSRTKSPYYQQSPQQQQQHHHGNSPVGNIASRSLDAGTTFNSLIAQQHQMQIEHAYQQQQLLELQRRKSWDTKNLSERFMEKIKESLPQFFEEKMRELRIEEVHMTKNSLSSSPNPRPNPSVISSRSPGNNPSTFSLDRMLESFLKKIQTDYKSDAPSSKNQQQQQASGQQFDSHQNPTPFRNQPVDIPNKNLGSSASPVIPGHLKLSWDSSIDDEVLDMNASIPPISERVCFPFSIAPSQPTILKNFLHQ